MHNFSSSRLAVRFSLAHNPFSIKTQPFRSFVSAPLSDLAGFYRWIWRFFADGFGRFLLMDLAVFAVGIGIVGGRQKRNISVRRI